MPVVFSQLVEAVLEEHDIREALDLLVEEKRNGLELDIRPAVPLFTHFLSHELARLTGLREPAQTDGDPEALNRFFRRHLPAAPTISTPPLTSLYS